MRESPYLLVRLVELLAKVLLGRVGRLALRVEQPQDTVGRLLEHRDAAGVVLEQTRTSGDRGVGGEWARHGAIAKGRDHQGAIAK